MVVLFEAPENYSYRGSDLRHVVEREAGGALDVVVAAVAQRIVGADDYLPGSQVSLCTPR